MLKGKGLKEKTVDQVPQFHVIYRRGPEIFILERTSKCGCCRGEGDHLEMRFRDAIVLPSLLFSRFL